MDRAGFDPRFSPEFQRGFDPAAHERAAASAQSHERIEPAPEPIPTVPKPVVRRVPPAPAETPTTGEQVPAAWVDDMFGEAGEHAGEDSGEALVRPVPPASPWRNPYLIALTVLGVALIAGGIGAFRWAVSQVFGGAVYESGASQEEIEDAMLAAQLAWGLSPLLALAGVLTLLGVFFFAAWRWRPQRELAADEPHADPNGHPTP